MSPLWSDRALADAAWADAVDRGLVEPAPKGPTMLERVRRIPRPRVHSFAL